MLLLDTCTLLWLALDQDHLSQVAINQIQTHAGHIWVSPISAFELGQKAGRGKLKLKLKPDRWFQRAIELHGLKECTFNSRIAFRAAALPDLHRDPFDRLLIATAQELRLTFLTPDPLIHPYPELKTAW